MTLQRINKAYDYLTRLNNIRPELIIVLGSGLGDFAETVVDTLKVDYAEIPGFPVSTTPGHKGCLILGKKFGKHIAVMQGRFHCYEGYTAQETVIPLRTLIKMGARSLLITNAAGGINNSFSAGDLALITDHINFASLNPLEGANIDSFGPRFPDMSYAYCKAYTSLLEKLAANKNIVLRKGVYAYMKGPSFETPAEIRALRTLGADLVGMSTVPEIIAAAHAGVKSCAISCVTNMAAGILDQPLTHDEVMQAGADAKERFEILINAFIQSEF
jgi:purine-nucleoside phosphorylase